MKEVGSPMATLDCSRDVTRGRRGRARESSRTPLVQVGGLCMESRALNHVCRTLV